MPVSTSDCVSAFTMKALKRKQLATIANWPPLLHIVLTKLYT